MWDLATLHERNQMEANRAQREYEELRARVLHELLEAAHQSIAHSRSGSKKKQRRKRKGK